MMRNLQFLLVLFGLIGFKNADTNKIKVESKSAKTIQNVGAIADFNLISNTEYIDFAEIRINGKLPMITKTKQLYNLLGKPDSIIVPNMDDVCTSFYNKPFKQAYLKNTEFEIYGDTAVVSSINFESNYNLEFTTKTIRLNHNTTLLGLQKLFPKAVKSKSELDVYKLGKTVAVSVATSKQLTDDSWLLLFKNGKLVRIDHYMPC